MHKARKLHISDNLKRHFITLLILLVTICINAQTPGSLDNTFGMSGIVVTPINISGSIVKAMTIQTDGKILVAGYSGWGSNNNEFAVARYNIDGTLDSTFGTNGIVLTQIGIDDASGNAIALQTDGKIIIAGYAVGVFHYDFALVRYNQNGTLDTIFGTNGKTITSLGLVDDVINAIFIQPDGKIVATGFAEGYFGLARYNTSGILDTTFGTGGTVLTNFGSAGCEAKAIAIQTNGKIVVAGQAWNSSGSIYTFKIMQFNSNGTLDTSFGTGGAIETVVGSHNDDRANAVAIQTDGKIIAAGWTYGDTGYDFALVRYNINGTLDLNFGTAGKAITSISSGYDQAYAVTLQTDGKIVTSGYASNYLSGNFALIRYNINGTLDNNFGTGGIVTTQIDIFGSGAYAVAVQPDGKIIAAGYSYSDSTINFALARYYGGIGSGVNEEKIRNTIKVYPNPASNKIIIDCNDLAKDKMISIFNIQGQVLFQKEFQQERIEIDIADYAKGIYFVKIKTANSIKTEKLIIQ